ncbi:MAG TPA: hypothetical protein DEB73_00670 [Candidatus Magasanikbacteria bacterium]|nr:hypothetical protein [Candidatus Magasanikbacteria bacterium]HBX16156.1 hypothetical protein [Candidatus Magasanikbacteria bacterium]
MIMFFVLTALVCGVILVMLVKSNKPKNADSRAEKQVQKDVAAASSSSDKASKKAKDLLARAAVGTVWFISYIDDRGRRAYGLFVRGDKGEAQLEVLDCEEVVEFNSRIPIHCGLLRSFIVGLDGILEKFVIGGDIGWAGTVLLRTCNEGQVYAGGLKAALRTVMLKLARAEDSSENRTAEDKLQRILDQAQGAPMSLISLNRDSQLFLRSS